MKRHQTTSMMHLHKLKPKDLIVLVKLSWKRMHNLSKLRKELSHHWVKVHTRKESPMDSKQGEKALVNRNRKLYEKQSKISNQKSRWLKDKHARHLKYCKHQNKRYSWKNNLLSYMKPKFKERESSFHVTTCTDYDPWGTTAWWLLLWGTTGSKAPPLLGVTILTWYTGGIENAWGTKQSLQSIGQGTVSFGCQVCRSWVADASQERLDWSAECGGGIGDAHPTWHMRRLHNYAVLQRGTIN